ncbi:Ap4A phosphorylase II [Trichodesmium erythraeum IMS101]|uniref:Ap4A phosphorylase II n=1 Tax=Trichodesmium erythraeum (strain IMS101) TaxID=203124 RepID=Q11A67_TRIEI|nr:phosphorylase [Trichodesmium erythraeum GBRTRLIN201]MCH2051216.1 phosphorylase [Trichodesmium sp. ALOHA_ZT_67]
MSENQLLLASGTLTERLKQQTKYALYCGALQPIPTEYEFVEQDNIRFVVRILSNLSGKEQARKQQEKNIIVTGQDFNPFLPYEKDLFVADISTTHLCLLNKYNVVDYHLLIVTREFEEQESLLNLQDFQALGSCMGEFEGLAFYNGGKTAGASQRHKHLQVVPLPMIPSGEKIPIDRAIATAKFNNGIGITSQFPFRHAIAKLDVAWVHSPVESAAEILEFYLTLLKAVGIESRDGMNGKQSGHYNLLVTGEWMLVVPRSYEYFQSISVNSLGFAGALLVKNQEQMNIIKEQKPLTILRHVAAG